MKSHDKTIDERLARLAQKAVAVRAMGTGAADEAGNTFTAYGLAALEVGNAIAATSGIAGLRQAFDFVEVNAGEHEAIWLSRRWAGITDLDGNTWG